ncbi:MAG: hypothetical protein CEE38_14245 [Planctomycetes bacterium B3_Pla]|nr:MAG: hypothetical protein CEE38_14245 [Planctomycetes bacterium B3_Pla]
MSKKLIYSIFFISMLGLAEGQAQDGYRLQPISGADGVFQTVIIDGVTVYRSFATRDSYHPYMYFRCSEEIHQQTVYLEVTYKDIGYGIFGVEYNSTTTNYQMAETGYENHVLGTGRERTAVFELTNADFRNAQNLKSDLRLWCEVTFQMNIVSAYVYLEPTPLFLENEGTFSLSQKAVKFDAPGDFLEVPHSATIAPSEFTIEFWFKVHGLGDPLAAWGEQTLLDKRGGWGLSDGYNIRLVGTQFPISVHALAQPGAVWTGDRIESNIWYHLAVVQDSDSLKMYFDGVLPNYSGSGENQYAANTRSPLRIGEFLGYPDAYLGLHGSIDELRIWNHPRSQSEIVAAMHEKLSGNEQGLAAYWDFDELVDGAVADLSPNSNDAILHGQASLIPSEVGMAPPSYADPNFTWDRAAYWDGRYPSGWAGGGEVMRDALEFAGYKILDADQLKTWMDARVTDGTPSVVVFCHCIAPDTVAESMSSICTLRRYLDAGGKIVWYADIPMFHQGHSDGTRTVWGNNGSINILGFDAASGPWDTQDEVTFTVNGVNWGLTETWQSERPTSGGGLRVLAEDNRGYAAAWVKHYVPGDNYRGFVRLFDRPGEPNINDVQRVAEYPYMPEPIVYYVDDDATGANDGSSWADAYWCLQDALAAVQYGDVIRVAQGSYKPDQRAMIGRGGLQMIGSSGDRTETFQLINGVVIKGGYAGISEPDPDARDIEAYETILSGDLNGDDIPVANPSDLLDEPTRAENSFHVVTGSWTDEMAVLDGFTITAGNANGLTTADKRGGGMYNQGGSPTLIRCIFQSNNSTPVYSGPADGGGAIYNADGNPALTQCTFTENNSARDGGGMFNINSRPTVTHCTFSGNSTDISGGGMYNKQSSPTVANCIFTGNSAQRGGGMRNMRNSNPTLTNCVFMGNWVESRRPGDIVGGGAMANQNSSPTLTNCILWGDTPEEIYGGTPLITYSDVQGGWLGEGNIDAEPLFVDADGADDLVGTEDDDLRLSPGSPCIDAGDNSAIPASMVVDLDGNPRIINGIVDMGAYELGMAPPPPILSEALDTDLSFTTGGNESWIGQTTTSYYAADAAQSGDISHSQDSWMQTTVSGPGTVTFYWNVSSEDNYDFLGFYIDGSLEDQISGSVNWQQMTYTIATSGSHTLEWRYVKDKDTDSGSDCGWVDKVEWVAN